MEERNIKGFEAMFANNKIPVTVDGFKEMVGLYEKVGPARMGRFWPKVWNKFLHEEGEAFVQHLLTRDSEGSADEAWAVLNGAKARAAAE